MIERAGGDGHGEHAALAEFAGDGDVAAEGLGNAAADRQSQAGAAVLTRHGGVRLNERIEDGLELLRGDSRAGVDDLNRKVRMGLVLHQLGQYLHASRFRELDGVAHQVHQELAEPRGIGADRFRHPARPMVIEGKPLLQGLDPQHGDDLADDGVGRAADLFDFQPVGFDFRQIEDVVQEGEEVFSAGVDDIQVIFALGRVVFVASFAQEVGEPDDGIQRGADFVAHVGQEPALGHARCFGSLPGRFEPFVQCLQFHNHVFRFVAGDFRLLDALLQLLVRRLQVLGHAIEGCGELPQLVLAVDRQRAGQVPGRHALRGRNHLPQRRGDDPPQQYPECAPKDHDQQQDNGGVGGKDASAYAGGVTGADRQPKAIGTERLVGIERHDKQIEAAIGHIDGLLAADGERQAGAGKNTADVLAPTLVLAGGMDPAVRPYDEPAPDVSGIRQRFEHLVGHVLRRQAGGDLLGRHARQHEIRANAVGLNAALFSVGQVVDQRHVREDDQRDDHAENLAEEPDIFPLGKHFALATVRVFRQRSGTRPDGH